jgi:hypothetical protein
MNIFAKKIKKNTQHKIDSNIGRPFIFVHSHVQQNQRQQTTFQHVKKHKKIS